MWHIIPCMLLCGWPQPPKWSSSIILLHSEIHCYAWVHLYLNLKRDPSRVKSLRLLFPAVGWRRRKKAWLSTAHFHRCLQLLALASWNTNVCSCSRPWTDPKEPNLVRQLVCVCVLTCIQDTNLIVVLHHDQRQSTLFKIQPSDFGPGGTDQGPYVNTFSAHLGPYTVCHRCHSEHHVWGHQDNKKKKKLLYFPPFFNGLTDHRNQSTCEGRNHLHGWFIKVSYCSTSSMTADTVWKFDSTHMTPDADRIWTQIAH